MTGKQRRSYGSGSITQRKDGYWIGRIEGGWTPQGTRRRITVSAKTEAECKRRLKAKQRDLAQGREHGLNVRETVKTWAETWLPQHAKKVRPTTFTTDRGAVNKWIIPILGHRRLADLTPGDLRKLEAAIRDAGRSSTTALHAHKTLLTMLKAAIVEGHHIPERVMLTPKPGKASNDRTALPLDEAWRIISLAGEQGDGSRWAAALLQGLRQSEALGLTWDRVHLADDLADCYIDVSWQLQELPYLNRAAGTFRTPDGFQARHLTGAQHLTRPKTAKGQRVIPVTRWMRAVLVTAREQWQPNPHNLVWADAQGRPIRPEDDRKRWHELQDAAGVHHPSGRHYHVHEARHTTATLLLAANVDRSVIEAILGQVVLVEAYLHVGRGQMLDALEKITGPLALEA